MLETTEGTEIWHYGLNGHAGRGRRMKRSVL